MCLVPVRRGGSCLHRPLRLLFVSVDLEFREEALWNKLLKIVLSLPMSCRQTAIEQHTARWLHAKLLELLLSAEVSHFVLHFRAQWVADTVGEILPVQKISRAMTRSSVGCWHQVCGNQALFERFKLQSPGFLEPRLAQELC